MGFNFKFKVYIKRGGKFELAAGFNRVCDVIGFVKETFSWETEEVFIKAPREVFYPVVIEQKHDGVNDYCYVDWQGFDDYR